MEKVSATCSSLIRPCESGTKMPAVTAMPSMPPYARTASASMARMLSRFVMSHDNPTAGPQPEIPDPATPMPAPCIVSMDLAVSVAASAFKSTQTMWAPSFTSRRETSRPMPLPAPITAITCRANSFSAGIV